MSHRTLSYALITPEKWPIIMSALAANSNLVSLNLWGCKLGNVGCVAVCEALCTNSTLTTLNINYTGFTDGAVKAMVKALRKNRTLATLSLKFNEISLDAQSKIQAAWGVRGDGIHL